MIRLLQLIVLFLLLQACGSVDLTDRGEPTLADLKKVAPPARDKALPTVTRKQVMDSYRQLLEVTDDPEIRALSLTRLGNLMMLESEDQQLDTSDEQQVARRYYNDVVNYYKQLLADYPDREGNDALLYQLSKAYDLDTRREESAEVLDRLVRRYPDSQYAAEAHFRSGEILFADGKYKEAQYEYEQVIRFGLDTPFFDNALYMKGWSEFKRSQYEDSLRSYWRVMNRIWPEDMPREELKKSRQELIEDTMRVMSLAFSYLDGPVSIRELTASAGPMHYEPLLYARLADLYLSKKRYKDTADTYQAFIDAYPQSDEAPSYHVKQIDAFDKGNFPTLILPAKQQYVENYGIHSLYWKTKPEDLRESLKPNLRSYLSELAKTSHAEAQAMKQLWQKSAGSKRRLAKLKFTEKEIFEEYRLAGRWYKEYVVTFPESENANEFWFLLAESQFEARDYQDAVGTYQRIAYAIPGHVKGGEAGYAALLAYNQHIDGLDPKELGVVERWEDRRIESSLQFAEKYSTDARAPAVLLKAAEDQLARKRYAEAVVNAGRVAEWPRPIDRAQTSNAWLVVGHGEFEQQNYAAAERAYSKLTRLLPDKDERKAAVVENLAASIYKQGENELALGNTRSAVDQFLRVGKVAPTSAIAANAEFDAATHMLNLKAWPEAIAVLTAFRKKNPNHELTKQIPAKLVLAYQENQQWGEAARELDALASNEDDPESARTATYLSAELYQKSGDQRKAIQLYSRYVARYPQPYEQQLEAVFQLSELQRSIGNQRESEKWMRRMISLDESFGAARTDRSRYLAAKSTLYFADQQREVFNSIKLTLPLKRSLGKKKKALQAALGRYEQAVAYEVQEFATRASYSIGEIYTQLSTDLMNSSRPAKMNELELEQYEVLLEEQAFPFEEQAIEIHETNAQRSWAGIYDEWVQRSFDSLAKLMPGRYAKQEQAKVFEDAIQ